MVDRGCDRREGKRLIVEFPEVENIVNCGDEALAFRVEEPQVTDGIIRKGAGDALQKIPYPIHHGRKGRFELMGDVRHEFRLRLTVLFQMDYSRAQVILDLFSLGVIMENDKQQLPSA